MCSEIENLFIKSIKSNETEDVQTYNLRVKFFCGVYFYHNIHNMDIEVKMDRFQILQNVLNGKKTLVI